LNAITTSYVFWGHKFDKAVSSAGPLIAKLATSKIAGLISPDYLTDRV
jgi:hypothetical protein